jgi:hypothetical protein
MAFTTYQMKINTVSKQTNKQTTESEGRKERRRKLRTAMRTEGTEQGSTSQKRSTHDLPLHMMDGQQLLVTI